VARNLRESTHFSIHHVRWGPCPHSNLNDTSLKICIPKTRESST
jgi:hypothetical protein